MTKSKDSEQATRQIYWQFGISHWLMLAIAIIVAGWAYYDGLANLVYRWETSEEYNHGYFLPIITVVFLWSIWPEYRRHPCPPSWFALIVAALALLLFLIGELSAIYLLIQYSFIILLLSLSLALVGWSGTRYSLAPIILLIFAIPIPYFLEATITSKLQLISSVLGVKIIRLCDIPVFRDGNLIDLGNFRLEVIEACSGLTYLYPLLGFGAICAYLYHAETWKRVLLIFSTIPIAILLNSFRIGMIGFLVKHFGSEQATGFLHDFEGFAVFMMCVAILFIEMWLLTFIGKNRRPFSEVFGLPERDMEIPAQTLIKKRPLSKPLLATTSLIVIASIIIHQIGERQEIKPQRQFFSQFPRQFDQWVGTVDVLAPEVLETLDLTDYLLVDYRQGNDAPVNFYVAYYESQRKGSSPHSPLVCLPGAGWQIDSIQKRSYDQNGDTFDYNRVVIKKGKQKQVIYYWFDERGQVITDEYQAKWLLLHDSIVKNRTDGALVRIGTPVKITESEQQADKRILALMKQVIPVLPAYIPR